MTFLRTLLDLDPVLTSTLEFEGSWIWRDELWDVVEEFPLLQRVRKVKVQHGCMGAFSASFAVPFKPSVDVWCREMRKSLRQSFAKLEEELAGLEDLDSVFLQYQPDLTECNSYENGKWNYCLAGWMLIVPDYDK